MVLIDLLTGLEIQDEHYIITGQNEENVLSVAKKTQLDCALDCPLDDTCEKSKIDAITGLYWKMKKNIILRNQKLDYSQTEHE